MLGSYVNGLKDHIKIELRLFDGTTLKKVMEWAEYINQKYSSPFFSQFLNTGSPPTRVNHPNFTPNTPTSSFINPIKSSSKPIYKTTIYPNTRPTSYHSYNSNQQTLELTKKEMGEKRAKGLYF